MANVSFFAPKYRHHKATGQAVVVIRGKYFYLGKHGSSSSREAYRRLVAEYMQTGTTPTQTSQDTITVVEVLAAYLKFARTYYRKNGKTTDELTAIKRAIGVVQELYGRKPACEFGPLALKTVQASMIDRGWCRNQINKHIDRVRRVFKWAVSEEIIPSSVHESLRTVSGLRRGRTKAKEGKPVRPIADCVVDATAFFGWSCSRRQSILESLQRESQRSRCLFEFLVFRLRRARKVRLQPIQFTLHTLSRKSVS